MTPAQPGPRPVAVRREPSRSFFWGALADYFGRSAWTIIVWGLFLLFILGPLFTVVAFSITGSVFQGIHPTAANYRKILTESTSYYPLLRSFEIAFIVVVFQIVLGTLIAFSTVRRRVFGAGIMDAMSNVTIALPSVVIGLALLAFYGPYGPINSLAELMLSRPYTLTWTLWIVVFAHMLETFPYMVRTVSTVLLQIPPNLESAARSLGAGRFTVFRTILLPQLRQSLLAGGVLVFSRSIAEFGATVVVVSAALKTTPVVIFEKEAGGNLELAAAYSVILMFVSLTIYLVVRRTLRDAGQVAFGRE